jgi:hypothetical protein
MRIHYTREPGVSLLIRLSRARRPDAMTVTGEKRLLRTPGKHYNYHFTSAGKIQLTYLIRELATKILGAIEL